MSALPSSAPSRMHQRNLVWGRAPIKILAICSLKTKSYDYLLRYMDGLIICLKYTVGKRVGLKVLCAFGWNFLNIFHSVENTEL